MNSKSRSIIAVVVSSIWVTASEFFRNEILLKTYWMEHYQSLGITFPSEPKNGILWVLWSVCFAIVIYFISRKFNLIPSALLSWFVAFVLMWIVIFNLSVLPISILVFAIPMSLLEAFIGACICLKIAPHE